MLLKEVKYLTTFRAHLSEDVRRAFGKRWCDSMSWSIEFYVLANVIVSWLI